MGPSPDQERASPTSRGGRLAVVALLTAGVAYLLFFSEWLFLVTKPSMFSVMGAGQKLAVLTSSGFLAALLAGAVASLLALSGRLWPAGWPRLPTGLVALLLPASILASMAFLLVDNFTRTVFGFNVGSILSPVRYAYAAGCVGLTLYLGLQLQRRLVGGPRHRSDRLAAVALGALLILSGGVAVARYAPPPTVDPLPAANPGPRPNVIILSSDGVRADHMSAYGYPRRTTPFLDSRLTEFLISENHFTNASATGGSVSALVSGKGPATTGVIEAWDAFRDEHVFEHLPGVLRQLGYHGVEFGPRSQATTHARNLRQGFHEVNAHTLRAERMPLLGWLERAFPAESFLAAEIAHRLGERVAHAFGLADMVDAYELLTRGRGQGASDEEVIAGLQEALDRAPRPLFANLHLMDTHTPYQPRQPLFSLPQNGGPNWPNDYDDVIGEFDRWVEKIVLHLETLGELDQTVLILNSDHGELWTTYQRLPLMIRFPHREHSGTLEPNTQRIDIAPTILDYLGVQTPSWMEGQSLIADALDPLRPIVSVGRRENSGACLLRSVAVTQCQRHFDLRLDGSEEVDTRGVEGHTAPCPEGSLLSESEVREYLRQRLAGFEN